MKLLVTLGGPLSLDPAQLVRISCVSADDHKRGTTARGVPSIVHNFHKVCGAVYGNGGKSATQNE